MRPVIGVILVLAFSAGCAATVDEPVVPPADVVSMAGQAFVDGYNNDDLSAFATYFATVQQGADSLGLANTLDAAFEILPRMPGVQPTVALESFSILDQSVDTVNGEATVRYQAQISIVQNEDESIFAGVVEQDVALMLVGGQWLISGGDAPQIGPVFSETLTGADDGVMTPPAKRNPA